MPLISKDGTAGGGTAPTPPPESKWRCLPTVSICLPTTAFLAATVLALAGRVVVIPVLRLTPCVGIRTQGVYRHHSRGGQ